MPARPPAVHLVSLGCPKNRVESEHMAAQLRARGMRLSPEPQRADAIVVHTCGFVAEAKAESVQVLLEMSQHKQRGRCRVLVATGCLVQRYVDELKAELPEVDAWLGTSTFATVGEVVAARLARARAATPWLDVPPPDSPPPPARCAEPFPARDLSDARGWAYLKIAEGCDRRCAFCIIPALRGPQRSRPADEILAEARALVAAGVQEIALVAQDLSAWGRDLEPRARLSTLLRALDQVEGLRWIRCLYAYPQGVTRDLVQVLGGGQRVLPYLDVPLQHASATVLRRMRRGRGGAALADRIADLRRAVPGLVLRTTMLVGFPGETEADHAELLRFVQATGFDRLGVFAYSDETGTPAAAMRHKVPRAVALRRQRAVLRQQRAVSRRRLRALRGTVHEAIVEGTHPDSELVVVGRLWSQAPEVDGVAFLSSPRPLRQGQLVRARVTASHDYDVVAEVLEPDDPSPAAPFGLDRG